jgi:catechol 2,3-dioxygenase-like lactoylglutathione lyase family enzyme
MNPIASSNLIQGLDTVIIRVSDYKASKEWYSENLNLSVVFDDTDMKLAVLDTMGPTSLTLWQTDKKVETRKDTAAYPIFRTPDARSLRLNLVERGVDVGEVITDKYVTFFRFFDPDGNVLEACQVHESS